MSNEGPNLHGIAASTRGDVMSRDTAPPVLHTPRLTMRAHRISDLDDAAEMWGDPAVVRHIGGRRFAREEVWHRILRYVGHWTIMSYGYWAVVERESGRFVGEMGFADWKRASLERYSGVPECGWVLAPWAHGRGFAAEALQAVLGWADANLGRLTICIITPENLPSIRLAEKVGYAPLGGSKADTADHVVFERGPHEVPGAELRRSTDL